jgi:hypothetical protein
LLGGGLFPALSTWRCNCFSRFSTSGPGCVQRPSASMQSG